MEGVTAPSPEESGLFASAPRVAQPRYVGMMSLDYMPARVAAAKRALDILVATIGLVVTAPLWPIIALAIKLDSPGEIFYRQIRVGRMLSSHTELFQILKFRSMRADAETRTGAVWAQRGDPRVTRVGRFLRKTRLDELPQIFNVLAGDMSLVGPRPERAFFTEQLRREIPFYDLRLAVKPGITGWAQILYPYGASVEDARSKLEFDLYYVKNGSPFLDAVIVFHTVKHVLFGRGAR